MVAERVERMREARRRRRTHAAVRHPIPRHRPAHRRRSLGRRGPAARRAWTRKRSPRRSATSPRRSPRASAGWPSCTAATPSASTVHPNVWAGIGLVRGGVGTALVGSYEEVADRIAEYQGLGFDEFILSGLPAPRRGVLVRRGRDARAAGPRAAPAHRDRVRARVLVPVGGRVATRIGLLMVGHVDPKSVAHRGRLPGAVRRAARRPRHRARAATTSTSAGFPDSVDGVRRLAVRPEPVLDLRRPAVAAGRRGVPARGHRDRGAVRRHLLRPPAPRAGARRDGRARRRRLAGRRARVRAGRAAAVDGPARGRRADHGHRQPPGPGRRAARRRRAARPRGRRRLPDRRVHASANGPGRSSPIPSSSPRSPTTCSRAGSS